MICLKSCRVKVRKLKSHNQTRTQIKVIRKKYKINRKEKSIQQSYKITNQIRRTKKNKNKPDNIQKKGFQYTLLKS